MKRHINLALVILIIVLTAGCGANTDMLKDGTFTKPVMKTHPRLMYPKIAQEKQLSGIPQLTIQINDKGMVDNVFLTKSSGYDVLDNAAMQYCKNLTFEPSKRNGEPVYSRMNMEIKFDFSDVNWDAYSYVEDIQDLYGEAMRSVGVERDALLKKAIEKHEQFIKNTGDALNFNLFVSMVISPKVTNEWKDSWDSWPLSFLLYYDFMQRFPDYKDLADVKKHLDDALKLDLQYINNTTVINAQIQKSKDTVLTRINQFMKNIYPNLLQPGLGTDKGLVSKAIS